MLAVPDDTKRLGYTPPTVWSSTLGVAAASSSASRSSAPARWIVGDRKRAQLSINQYSQKGCPKYRRIAARYKGNLLGLFARTFAFRRCLWAQAQRDVRRGYGLPHYPHELVVGDLQVRLFLELDTMLTRQRRGGSYYCLLGLFLFPTPYIHSIRGVGYRFEPIPNETPSQTLPKKRSG